MTALRFCDDSGWHWEVVEHTPRRASRDRDVSLPAQHCLYFLSRYETRRTSSFPVDWARRSSAELAQLCDDAIAL